MVLNSVRASFSYTKFVPLLFQAKKMISHQHKCIFIHIPKTAGSSMENLIWSEHERTESNLWMGFISKYRNKIQTGGLQHLLASQVKKEVGEEIFSSYFKFTIVRNPWDKAVSQYEFTKRRKDLRDYIGMSENDEFIKYLSLIQKRLHVQWEKQCNFVLEGDSVIVDFIGRFESFEADAYKILDKVGIETGTNGVKTVNIPHIKKNPSRLPYTAYYDTESKEIIQEMYKDDIKMFNYQF